MIHRNEEAVDILETACNMLDWHVFACYGINTDGVCTCNCGTECSSPGKHPATPNGFKDAVSHQDAVRHIRLFGNDRNVAIACQRSRILVVDIDPRNCGHLSFESLKQLTNLPDLDTVEALTGNYFVDGIHIRGRHLYFEVPENASFVTQLPAFRGIDFKHNGYVIAPPSMHFTGVSYEWVDGHSPEEIQLLPLPEALASLLKTVEYPNRSLQESVSPEKLDALNAQPFGDTARTALSNLVDEIRTTQEGQRNNQTFKSAAKVASWAAAGSVPLGEALDEVAQASIETGLSQKEVIDTIIRAVPYGFADPQVAYSYEPWMDQVAKSLSNRRGPSLH
jgi:hypothetical protein